MDMTFTYYTKHIAKFLFCVCSLLIFIQKTVALTVDVYLDAGKLAELTAINIALAATHIPILNASKSINNAGNSFEATGPDLKSILDTLNNNNTFPAWATTTDPSTPASLSYVTNVTTAEDELKKLTISDKPILDNLEKDNFDNTDADNNSASQYSQGNNNHETVFKNGVLCPGDPKSTAKDYSTLEYKACNIINNATAYKIKLSESAQKKQKVIDDAIVDILKKLPQTMGNFEARRVALSDLQALQKNVIDEYDLKAKNADLQIKIAEEARRYASEAMLVAPTKNTTGTVVTATVKTALGAALNNIIPATIPYNE